MVRCTATYNDRCLILICEDNSIKTIHLSDVSEPTLRLFHLWLYGQCSREIPDLDVDEIKCELSAKRHKGAGNNEQLFPVQEPLFLGGELLDEADQEEIKEEFEEYSSASDDTSDSEAGSNESNVDPQELMNEVSALAEETREIRQGRQWLVVSEGTSTSPSYEFTLSKNRFSILERFDRASRYFSRPLCFRHPV